MVILLYELDQNTIKLFFQMTTFELSGNFGGTVSICLILSKKLCLFIVFVFSMFFVCVRKLGPFPAVVSKNVKKKLLCICL